MYANAAKTSTLNPNLDSQTFALAGAAPGASKPFDPNPPEEAVYWLGPGPDSGSLVRYEGFVVGSSAAASAYLPENDRIMRTCSCSTGLIAISKRTRITTPSSDSLPSTRWMKQHTGRTTDVLLFPSFLSRRGMGIPEVRQGDLGLHVGISASRRGMDG